VVQAAAMSDPIGLGQAAVLGALQGATEFLPISSDGHLAIGAMLFGTTEMPLAFVVMLHAGTLLATLLAFRKDVAQLVLGLLRGLREPRAWLRTDDGWLALTVVVASVPTAIVGLALEDTVEAWADVKWIVGVCLLGSAAAVGLTSVAQARTERLSLGAACVLGVAQGLAVLPGLSRSGSTIACAMLLGLGGPAAFRLSFILSLPAVGGAVLLKALDREALAGLGMQAALGAVVAFVVGLTAIWAVRETVSRGKLWLFALYLVPLGLALVLWQWTS
jgi:undecaprenyl-diphosphatase